MKRVLCTTIACAAMLLMVAQAAWAGAFFLRAASGEIPSGSNCTRQTVQVPSAAPYTAMRCPSTGGSFNLNLDYPTDSTVIGITPVFNASNPDASIGGFYCWQVCMGVIATGENRNAANLTSCAMYDQPLSTAFASGAQNTVFNTVGVLTPVIPNHVTGAGCTTPATCAGYELIVQVTRLVDNFTCPNNAAQNIDFHGIELLYQ